MFFGGTERIWTSAALANPSSLANCPLQPLGYCSIKKLAERVGFEPTIGYKPMPIFKTGALNQLDHLSIYCLPLSVTVYILTFYLNIVNSRFCIFLMFYYFICFFWIYSNIYSLFFFFWYSICWLTVCHWFCIYIRCFCRINPI